MFSGRLNYDNTSIYIFFFFWRKQLRRLELVKLELGSMRARRTLSKSAMPNRILDSIQTLALKRPMASFCLEAKGTNERINDTRFDLT